MKKESSVMKMVLSAVFLAIGLVLPFLTGQIQIIGNMLLPMHYPVLLCGLICGWKYGLMVGFVMPLMRSVLFGMPVMYPAAIAMAFELAAYGAVIGFLYWRLPWKCMFRLYRCLLLSMVTGRIVWGGAQLILMGVNGKLFTWSMFIAGALLNAIPGIVLQLILIPMLMVLLNRTGLPVPNAPAIAAAHE